MKMNGCKLILAMIIFIALFTGCSSISVWSDVFKPPHGSHSENEEHSSEKDDSVSTKAVSLIDAFLNKRKEIIDNVKHAEGVEINTFQYSLKSQFSSPLTQSSSEQERKNIYLKENVFRLKMMTDFSKGKVTLNRKLKRIVEKLVSSYSAEDRRKIVVIAFTDSGGVAMKNEAVSEGRAKAIAEYFVTAGHDAYANIYYIGAGESVQVKDAQGYDSVQSNRRIEIIDGATLEKIRNVAKGFSDVSSPLKSVSAPVKHYQPRKAKELKKSPKTPVAKSLPITKHAPVIKKTPATKFPPPIVSPPDPPRTPDPEVF